MNNIIDSDEYEANKIETARLKKVVKSLELVKKNIKSEALIKIAPWRKEIDKLIMLLDGDIQRIDDRLNPIKARIRKIDYENRKFKKLLNE